MSNYDTPRRERLAAEVRSRLQTDLGPETRALFERALEAIPKDSPLYLETLEEELAKAPERLERELANSHRNSGVRWTRPAIKSSE
jgi:hypothetical protein